AGQARGTPDGAPLVAAVRELRRSRYDVAIDLQGLIKSALLARASGAPRVVGFSSRYARERAARLFYTPAHNPARPGLYHPPATPATSSPSTWASSRFSASRRRRASFRSTRSIQTPPESRVTRPAGDTRCSIRAPRGRTNGGRLSGLRRLRRSFARGTGCVRW